VGVAVGRGAVGAPACMADAVGTGRLGRVNDLREGVEFAGLAEHVHRGAQRDPRRVVAAVLQTAEPVHQDVDGALAATDAADDPTHQRTTSLPASMWPRTTTPSLTVASGPTSAPGSRVAPPPTSTRSAMTPPRSTSL